MDKIVDITAKVLPDQSSADKMQEAYEQHRLKMLDLAKDKVSRMNKHRMMEEWQTTALKSAGVPARFLKANMNQFPKQFAIEYVNSFSNAGGSGLITGATGTGKTHLAVAFMRTKLERNKVYYKWDEAIVDYKMVIPMTPRFITSPSLLVEIRGTFGRSEDTNAIIEKYLKADCLVLDDLGAEKTTDWSMEVLYLIIDSRYSHMKQLLVTSNLDIDEIAARLGDRIASRLSGLGFVLTLEGKDRRLPE